jgi:hypothetical protein
LLTNQSTVNQTNTGTALFAQHSVGQTSIGQKVLDKKNEHQNNWFGCVHNCKFLPQGGSVGTMPEYVGENHKIANNSAKPPKLEKNKNRFGILRILKKI